MKDVKKIVLWVLVGFCMISVLAGLFNLFAFLQMAATEIYTFDLPDKESIFFIASTVVEIVCAIFSIALIVVAVIFLLKHSESGKSKSILAFIIAALAICVVLAICVIFIVYPFLTLAIFKVGNDTFHSYNMDGKLIYSSFAHYQLYLSAVLSTFLPLLIAACLLLGNVVCKIKFQICAEAGKSEANKTSANSVESTDKE